VPEGEDKELYRLTRVAGQAMFIPVFLVVFPLAFRWVGVQLDAWCGTGPWLGRVFLGLGLVSACRQVVKLVRRIISDMS
jgi:F0F1-type ATP synthase assembly protein I